MARRYWQLIHIDRDPSNILKGWGRVELLVDDVKRLRIPTSYPSSYTNRYSLTSWEQRMEMPNNGGLSNRGRAGTKKFVVAMSGESIELRAQKDLTIAAIGTWLKTWAAADAQLITPGGRTHKLDGQKVSHQTNFIYFIFNADSHAVKIGRAKNVSKRLQALQTSSPALLKLLKTIPVDDLENARALERALHQQFSELRLYGEWFRADSTLMEYIDKP